MRLQQFKNNYLYEGLDYSTSHTMMLWESAGVKLKEAALTADQIQQIFQSVEQGATAAGGNRTMLGKGKDAASAVNKAWEDLKTKVQNSGPIKNVDNAYDSAVAKIEAGLGGPDNAINKVIQKYRTFAKAHPIAQGLIYSALIAAAGISGAGLGGAAVLGLLKMTDKLLQGEKFSSAAYSGAKTGALAYGASKVADLFKGVQPAPDAATSGVEKGLSQEQVDYLNQLGKDGATPIVKDNTLWVKQPDGTVQMLTPPKGVSPDSMLKIVNDAGSGGVQTAASAAGEVVKGAGADMFKGLASDSMADATIKRIADGIAAGQLSSSDLQHLQASQGFVANALSNADPAREAALTAHYNVLDKMLRAANDIRVESKIRYIDTGATSRVLSEGQVYMIFNRVSAQQQLTEGPMDFIKGAAAKGMDKLKTVGTNLTTKVTADKLNSAWQKAGSPMDSEEVAAILKQAGVGDDVVGKVYTDLKLPAPGTAPAADAEKNPVKAQAATGGYAEVKKAIAQLNTKDRQRMIAYLTKQLGTA